MRPTIQHNGSSSNGTGNGQRQNSSSAPLNLRPKLNFNNRSTMSDREEMDSTAIAANSNKMNNDLIKKPAPEIPPNHPLAKNLNNLSALIKTKDSHHHHHHHHSSSNKTNSANRTATGMSRDELLSKFNEFYQTINDDLETIYENIRSLKMSKAQINQFVEYLIDQSLHEQNKQIESIVRLVCHLHKVNFIASSNIIQVISNILSKIHDYEKELSLFKSNLAMIIARLIHQEQEGLKRRKSQKEMFVQLFVSEKMSSNSKKSNGSSSTTILSLNDICDLMKDGQHHPLFLLLLQELQQMYKNDRKSMFVLNLFER